MSHSVVIPKRISDIAHNLQLILKKVFDESVPTNRTLKQAHEFVKRFKRSTKAQKLLIKSAKKTVLNPTDIRWGTSFIMIDRLLDIYSHAKEIALQRNWHTLSEKQLKYLRAIHVLIKPYFDLIIRCQSEKFTLSKVYFSIIELLHAIEKIQVLKAFNFYTLYFLSLIKASRLIAISY